MTANKLFLSCVFFFFVIFWGCSPKEVPLNQKATFDVIQDEILTKNCAVSGCHASEADGTFLQHGLILSKGKAYTNLFNTIPKNVSANEDGLKRVTPFDAQKSLLYHKLIFNQQHHGGKSYGSVMPLGKDILTNGQIELVRQWIESGASADKLVADVALLKDTTKSSTNFIPLEVPKAGEGFQMVLEPFEIFPNFEREIFMRKLLGNSETVYINRFKINMRQGSHHFILYGFKSDASAATVPLNQLRDLRNKDGSLNVNTFFQMANHVFYFGGSESILDYTFPDNMAVELPANMSFDMNSHYFNKGVKSYNGEVNINLYTVPKEKVKHVLKVLNFGNQSFTLPPNQKTVITKSFKFDTDVKIAMLFSHTHRLGEKFEILINGGSRNGEVVYTNTNWEHPLKINYPTPISLKKGEGLTSRITYNNFTNNTVGFGFTSEDEMGIIFGYYYEE